MVSLKQSTGEVRPPIIAAGWTADTMAKQMKALAEKQSFPAVISVDEATSGGLFGKRFPCIVIRHPNPPQSYFEQWIVFNNDIINFQFGGYSAANANVNRQEERKQSGKLSSMLLGAVMKDSSMELQAEMLWHGQIQGMYEAILLEQE